MWQLLSQLGFGHLLCVLACLATCMHVRLPSALAGGGAWRPACPSGLGALAAGYVDKGMHDSYFANVLTDTQCRLTKEPTRATPLRHHSCTPQGCANVGEAELCT